MSDKHPDIHSSDPQGVTPITVEEMRAHMKRVETLSVILRDILLAMADIPPFNMMVSAEQKALLKAL